MNYHRQFAVQNNTDVSNGIDWLNSNRAQIETNDVVLPELHQVGFEAEPDPGLAATSVRNTSPGGFRRMSAVVGDAP